MKIVSVNVHNLLFQIATEIFRGRQFYGKTYEIEKSNLMKMSIQLLRYSGGILWRQGVLKLHASLTYLDLMGSDNLGTR